MAKQRRVLTIAGPRNSGKSSLAKMLFPRHAYLDLENPRVGGFARSRPGDFFGRVSGDVILDEYRSAPELFPYIREAAARRRQIVLVTSRLSRQGASLRRLSGVDTGTVILLPLSLRELCGVKGACLERDELIHRGFMPCAHGRGAAPQRMFLDHYSTHVEGVLLESASLYVREREAFRSFIRLLAGRVGQIINLGSLSKAVGVPPSALTQWMSALEAAFIIFRLPSYPSSRGVRTPKFYFTDVGLAAYLLGIKNPKHVIRDPSVGSLFENMVVADAFKVRYNLGLGANLYYYRRHCGLEIDLILRSMEGAVVPMEIKSSAEYNSAFADNIRQFSKFSSKIKKGYVIYGGKDSARGREGEVKFVNFRNVWELLQG
ncbi:MAG: DUF4143 domain-containing protein [Chitinispirillales bacterium]|nr:DUF4143 domain-containing protein [Chitinispirillales bacterium]